MALLSLRGIAVSFGGPPLLDGVDLSIERGERLCLVGRNGSGKSTLMKVLAGEITPDDGEMVRQGALRVARLTQEVPRGLAGSVYDVVAAGLGEAGALLAEYHHVSQQLALDGSDEWLRKLEQVQHRLEAAGGWELNREVETVLSRLELPAEAEFSALSGGLKRRVLLAQALITRPDLLLLDEPTNHLDIDAIAWLEEFLLGFNGTLLFVTHDRTFLQRLATRIIELDRGRLTSWPGDFATYLRRKQEALDAESGANALFDKRLAEEEVWIRQGIKARRTRNEGRVRALEAMRRERQERRERQGTARLQLNEADRSGKLVVEAEGVSFSYDGKPVIKDLSTVIMRGDKVGIIGPNGAGKTTLLRLLLGQLAPQQGTVRLGTKLEVAYFDQHRALLDEEMTVLDNVAQGSEQITVNGESRHVISYLQDFLFAPARARTPVKALSGGERNRLLLARLFTQPANVLVMDEPTNDLDMETLELLESLLVDYAGTLLVVSHDRAFLDNVVTSTLVFEGDGRIGDYVGGYEDWLRQRRVEAPARAAPAAAAAERREKPKPKAKMGYKEQRELETLPQRIEALEAEQQALHQAMSAPDFYQRDKAAIAAAQDRLAALEDELAAAYERWEMLEAQQQG
ncbi:MAG: ABC transporter ATP-binding protein [Gammaproteobacteria bacterium HGW-Gammaproteobacteria-1]|jgi:ATP-binding cassette subfamily F protein uup|nr:MAG: ABC transporter ATP-binding protein [Gammaproteobacteria bacterium HGW-Gammaproteobacteria-1]